MKKNDGELQIFSKWFDFTKWILARTEAYPKSARFTFADRINNLVLDFIEKLVDARFSSARLPTLTQCNLILEKLRWLIRLSFEQRFISIKQYEFAAKKLDETGGMLGAWVKTQKDLDSKK